MPRPGAPITTTAPPWPARSAASRSSSARSSAPRPTSGTRDSGAGLSSDSPSRTAAPTGCSRPLRVSGATLLQAEPAVDPLAGPLADQDRAGCGGGLEASGDVHGVADDGVLDHPADLARSGNDLAGLDADPQAQREAVRPLQLLVEPFEGALHRQRRAQGTGRIVLVGDRRAEQDHDGVADQFIDGPLEADRLGGELTEAVGGDVADVLRVKPLGEGGEADEIGEEDGDLTPLLGRRGRSNGNCGRGWDRLLLRPSGAPHSPQKRSSGSLAVPQAAQRSGSRLPQARQNFRVPAFSAPQVGHPNRVLAPFVSVADRSTRGV